jgi:predicted dehydrogenase
MQKNQIQPTAGVETRRDFLKKTASATAAVAATGLLRTPVYGQSTAPSSGRVIGANDRIAVAVIGIGMGIGQNHFKGMYEEAGKNNVVVAAACDLFNKRRDWAKETAKLTDADMFADHRKLLERKDIDAVVVATHDPWHAPISLDAMDAGKHVYCEKPMTRYLDEAFQVYDKVKSTKRVFQVGSQGCSAGGWHKCADLINAGKIGTLVWAQGYYCRNNPTGEWNYKLHEVAGGKVVDGATNPDNIDWQRWLGAVRNKVEFSADHFHRWRKYYPYCGGLLGDLVPHRLHPLMVASGNPEFPIRVTSIGTKNVHTDKKFSPPTPERDVPEHVQLTAEFPSGYMITVTCSTVNAKSPGFVIYGHKATLSIGSSGEKVELVPEKEFTEEIDGEPFSGLQPEDLRVHEKNWFDCIRSGKEPNANIDLAVKVQTIISLAEMAERLKITCLFDEKTRSITTGDGKKVKAITYGTLALS